MLLIVKVWIGARLWVFKNICRCGRMLGSFRKPCIELSDGIPGRGSKENVNGNGAQLIWVTSSYVSTMVNFTFLQRRGLTNIGNV